MAAPAPLNVEPGSGLWKMAKSQKAISEGMEGPMYDKMSEGLERNGDRQKYKEYALKMENTFLELMESMNEEHEIEGVRKEFFEGATTDGLNCDVTVFRPDNDDILPGVVYIHGGGMAILTGKEPILLSGGWMMADKGCVYMMVHFTNSHVEAFPRGLNDCCDAVKWFISKAEDFKIDLRGKGVMVTGESGGGNLCIATAMKLKDEEGLVSSCFARCPFVSLENKTRLSHFEMRPAETPDSMEAMEWIFYDLYTAQDSEDRSNPLAWPILATKEDLQGLCPTMILVNECDTLRDDGMAFYRKLQDADIPSWMQMIGGTMHSGEIWDPMWMNLSMKQAVDFAKLCLDQDFSPKQEDEVAADGEEEEAAAADGAEEVAADVEA